MKKSLLLLLFVIGFSISASAQANLEKRAEASAQKSFEMVDAITKLSDSEKEIYLVARKKQAYKHLQLARELRDTDPDQFRIQSRGNVAVYAASLTKSFGEKRAMEIRKAERKK